MITNEFLLFLLIWGGWLSASVIMDFFPTLTKVLGAIRFFRQKVKGLERLHSFPTVTTIVPAYNAAKIIEFCILALLAPFR